MQVPEARIELAASAEESRWSLQAVQLDVQDKRLYATEGHVLASIPAGELAESDTTGLIPVAALKEARKHKKPGTIIQVNGNIRIESTDGAVEMPRPTGTFPNVEGLIRNSKPEPDAACTISLDAELLYRLARAIGANRSHDNPKGLIVRLWIADKERAIYIDGGVSNEGFGLLMPYRS